MGICKLKKRKVVHNHAYSKGMDQSQLFKKKAKVYLACKDNGGNKRDEGGYKYHRRGWSSVLNKCKQATVAVYRVV